MVLRNKLVKEIEQIKSQRHQILYVIHNEIHLNVFFEELKKLNIPIYNVSLEVSKHTKEFPIHRRPREVSKLLRQLIHRNDIVCLDKLEYLFDIELKQNLPRLFNSLSGNTALIVLWPGTVEHSQLVYAEPGHPEHKKFEINKENILRLEN